SGSKQLRTLDQRVGAARRIEIAEYVGPGTVAPHCCAEAAIAVGEAADRAHCDTGPLGGFRGGGGEDLARHWHVIERPPAPASDTDVDRDCTRRSGVRCKSGRRPPRRRIWDCGV